jgi:peptidase M23-like protein
LCRARDALVSTHAWCTATRPIARTVATVPALALLALLLGALFAPPPAQATTWHWPLHGPVQKRFAYTAATPFTRGQHRGITIAGPAGAPVRAACPGRVTFAGRLPNRPGAGVTINCGALTATYLRLASLAVRRGDQVAVGDRLGRLGPRGLHLGARRTGRRWDYVDPLALLGRDPSMHPRPLVRAPRWRTGPGPIPTRPRPAPLPLPLRWSAPTAAAARPVVPLVAWLGLALLAGALPALGLRHARRRRPRREAARSRHAPPDAA